MSRGTWRPDGWDEKNWCSGFTCVASIIGCFEEGLWTRGTGIAVLRLCYPRWRWVVEAGAVELGVSVAGTIGTRGIGRTVADVSRL